MDQYEVGVRPLIRPEISYMIPKKGSITFRADKHVIRNFDNQYYWLYSSEGDSNLKTSNKVKPYQSYDLTFQWFFYDKEKLRKRKVTYATTPGTSSRIYNHLSGQWDNRMDAGHSLKFQCRIPTRRIFSVRTGLLHYRTIVNNHFAQDGLTSKSGTVISTGQASHINALDSEDETYLTNYYSNALYLGLSMQRISNLSYKYLGHSGEDQFKSNFYIDVFLTNISKANKMEIKSSGNSYNVLHDKKGGFKESNMGLRIGYQYTTYLSRHSALSLRLEAGRKVGISNIINEESIFSIYPGDPRGFFEASIAYTWEN